MDRLRELHKGRGTLEGMVSEILRAWPKERKKRQLVDEKLRKLRTEREAELKRSRDSAQGVQPRAKPPNTLSGYSAFGFLQELPNQPPNEQFCSHYSEEMQKLKQTHKRTSSGRWSKGNERPNEYSPGSNRTNEGEGIEDQGSGRESPGSTNSSLTSRRSHEMIATENFIAYEETEPKNEQEVASPFSPHSTTSSTPTIKCSPSIEHRKWKGKAKETGNFDNQVSMGTKEEAVWTSTLR